MVKIFAGPVFRHGLDLLSFRALGKFLIVTPKAMVLLSIVSVLKICTVLLLVVDGVTASLAYRRVLTITVGFIIDSLAQFQELRVVGVASLYRISMPFFKHQL